MLLFPQLIKTLGYLLFCLALIFFQFKKLIAVPATASSSKKFAANIASGGLAGATSLTVVYPLEYARTRLSNNTKGKDGMRQFNGYAPTYT